MASWTERRLVNVAVRIGVRLGREIDGVRELEVRGRRTGRRRRTPVKVVEVDGERYLVSLNGSSGWVCNLREGNEARLRFGRRVEEIVLTEVPDGQKPPVIRAYLADATRPETRRRLERRADAIPVFRVGRRP